VILNTRSTSPMTPMFRGTRCALDLGSSLDHVGTDRALAGAVSPDRCPDPGGAACLSAAVMLLTAPVGPSLLLGVLPCLVSGTDSWVVAADARFRDSSELSSLLAPALVLSPPPSILHRPLPSVLTRGVLSCRYVFTSCRCRQRGRPRRSSRLSADRRVVA
jgi:hypothetical protein